MSVRDASLKQLVEVIDTDILAWNATRALRTPLTQVDLTIVPIGVGTDWAALVPRNRAATARRFLRREDTGAVALVDGRFAGWMWLSRRSHRDPYSGLYINLERSEAYAYALWVEPDMRPRGVARALTVALLETVAADPGIDRVYGWVDKSNRESQVLLRLLGFKDVQSVRRVMLVRRRGWPLARTITPLSGPLSRPVLVERHTDLDIGVLR